MCTAYTSVFIDLSRVAPVIPFALSFFTTCGAVASPLHRATPERRGMAYAAKPLQLSFGFSELFFLPAASLAVCLSLEDRRARQRVAVPAHLPRGLSRPFRQACGVGRIEACPATRQTLLASTPCTGSGHNAHHKQVPASI